jgi:WD40 repeat protein
MRLIHSCVALILLPVTAVAQDNVFTPQHIAKLRVVTEAVIAPDGSQVAYVLSVPRNIPKEKDGPAWTELHVVDTKGNSTPFITGPVNVGNIAWTPDGKSIAFDDATTEGAFMAPPHTTCIETDSWWIVANFRQSTLENIRPGQPAGIACKTYPGRIFSGTVQSVGWGVDEGQGVPSGKLPRVKNSQQLLPSAQRFQVRLMLDNPDELPLRVGATASVTVYTDPDFVLNPLAEFWQRIESWLYYLR